MTTYRIILNQTTGESRTECTTESYDEIMKLWEEEKNEQDKFSKIDMELVLYKDDEVIDDYEIIDARAATRFAGTAPEPRAGLRSGHIPGSKNVCYRDLLRSDNTMKDPDVLRQVFVDAGVDLAKPAITSCGSGVTAAILNLAMQRIGKTNHSLYDGSWSEWGMSPTLPVATGDN